MLIRGVLSQATTDKEYKSILKRRLILIGIILILGIITIIFSFLFSFGEDPHLSDFLSGVYCGVGGAVTVGSIINIVKIIHILKDEKKIKLKRIEEQDERNQMIAQKAMNTGGNIVLIITYIGLLVSGIFNIVVFWTLWVVVMVSSAIFAILHLYYNKKL
jgi:hypothetical protein